MNLFEQMRLAMEAHTRAWGAAEEAEGPMCPCRTGAPHPAGATVDLDVFTQGCEKSMLWLEGVRKHMDAGGRIRFVDWDGVVARR